MGTDHLGSTLRVTDSGFSALAGDARRYTPYGGHRNSPPDGLNLGTDKLFTGQTWDASVELYWYVSRAYDPALGRFTGPDTVVPEPKNPQALNRYSYTFNNPLNRIDPDGHDPLDANWRAWWTENVGLGNAPDWRAESLQLFAIAFEEEFNRRGGWGFFYADGNFIEGSLRAVYQSPGPDRNWAAMQGALARLAGRYEWNEEALFVQDVAFLFAGLRPRSEGTLAEGVFEGQTRVAAFLMEDGSIDPEFMGRDGDANVHHWAWAFAAGYETRSALAGAMINVGHEVDDALRQARPFERSDFLIGNAGAAMGSALSTALFGPAQAGMLLRWFLPIR